jgi:hypothetical protein
MYFGRTGNTLRPFMVCLGRPRQSLRCRFSPAGDRRLVALHRAGEHRAVGRRRQEAGRTVAAPLAGFPHHRLDVVATGPARTEAGRLKPQRGADATGGRRPPAARIAPGNRRPSCRRSRTESQSSSRRCRVKQVPVPPLLVVQSTSAAPPHSTGLWPARQVVASWALHVFLRFFWASARPGRASALRPRALARVRRESRIATARVRWSKRSVSTRHSCVVLLASHAPWRHEASERPVAGAASVELPIWRAARAEARPCPASGSQHGARR